MVNCFRVGDESLLNEIKVRERDCNTILKHDFSPYCEFINNNAAKTVRSGRACATSNQNEGVPYHRFVTGGVSPLRWVRRLSPGLLHKDAWPSELSSNPLPIMSVPPPNLENAIPPPNRSRGFVEQAKTAGMTILHHAKKHTGIGIVCAVAYFDP